MKGAQEFVERFLPYAFGESVARRPAEEQVRLWGPQDPAGPEGFQPRPLLGVLSMSFGELAPPPASAPVDWLYAPFEVGGRPIGTASGLGWRALFAGFEELWGALAPAFRESTRSQLAAIVVADFERAPRHAAQAVASPARSAMDDALDVDVLADF